MAVMLHRSSFFGFTEIIDTLFTEIQAFTALL